MSARDRCPLCVMNEDKAQVVAFQTYALIDTRGVRKSISLLNAPPSLSLSGHIDLCIFYLNNTIVIQYMQFIIWLRLETHDARFSLGCTHPASHVSLGTGTVDRQTVLPVCSPERQRQKKSDTEVPACLCGFVSIRFHCMLLRLSGWDLDLMDQTRHAASMRPDASLSHGTCLSCDLLAHYRLLPIQKLNKIRQDAVSGPAFTLLLCK